MHRGWWIVLGVVMFAGAVGFGFLPYSKSAPIGPPTSLGSVTYPDVVDYDDKTGPPQPVTIHCPNLLQTPSTIVMGNFGVHADNPCRSGLAMRRVAWGALFIVSIGAIGSVLFGRRRTRSDLTSAALQGSTSPTTCRQ